VPNFVPTCEKTSCISPRGLDLLNLAITTNARGGPGIVLASVAFDAAIISPTFYTTLVLAAIVTSQFAGAWLDYVPTQRLAAAKSGYRKRTRGRLTGESVNRIAGEKSPYLSLTSKKAK
jgi:hypothetical protein